MGWLCKNCSNYNEDSYENCIVCDSARPDITLVTLNAKKVAELGLTGEVLIPIDYNIIGENAFKNRKDITCVILHENLKRIGKCAFSGCENLREIRSYASLETISTRAFYDCTSLADCYKLGADYLAPDAYDSTLGDIKKATLATLKNEHEDYYFNESLVDTKIALPKIKRESVECEKVAEVKGEDKEEIVDYKKISVEKRKPKREYKDFIKYNGGSDIAIEKSATAKPVAKTAHEKSVDITLVLAIIFALLTAFFTISHFTSLINNSLIFLQLFGAFCFACAINCLTGVICFTKTRTVGNAVNSAIALLFIILALVFIIWTVSLRLLATCFAISISLQLLLKGFLAYNEGYYMEKYLLISILHFVGCGILFIIALVGFILVL